MTQTAAVGRVAPVQDRFWSKAAAVVFLIVVAVGLFWQVSQRGAVAPTQSKGLPPPKTPAVAVDGRGSVDPKDARLKPAPAPIPAPAARVEPEWEKDIKSKLSNKITFEVTQTQFKDAVGYLRSLANVTIIVDPQLFTEPQATITLSMTDVTLETALKQICDIVGAEVLYKDKSVFIARASRVKPEAQKQQDF
jgi:hypothetical protein